MYTWAPVLKTEKGKKNFKEETRWYEKAAPVYKR